jgi:hypothetical protein
MVWLWGPPCRPCSSNRTNSRMSAINKAGTAQLRRDCLLECTRQDSDGVVVQAALQTLQCREAKKQCIDKRSSAQTGTMVSATVLSRCSKQPHWKNCRVNGVLQVHVGRVLATSAVHTHEDVW